MQGNYGEFMSQYIMDSFAGETLRANPANPVTIKRRRLHKILNGDVNEALRIVKRHIPRIDKYILSKGETPLSNLAEKSVQAYILKSKEISDVSRALGIPDSEAQIFLDQAEASGFQMNHPDTENFLGEIFAAIAPIAQKGIDKVAARRAAKGKPAGIFGALATGGTKAYNTVRGMTPEQIAQQAAAAGQASDIAQTPAGKGNILDEIKIGAKDIIRSVGDQERKAQLQKMLPYFIIGAALLFIVVFLAARSGKR